MINVEHSGGGGQELLPEVPENLSPAEYLDLAILSKKAGELYDEESKELKKRLSFSQSLKSIFDASIITGSAYLLHEFFLDDGVDPTDMRIYSYFTSLPIIIKFFYLNGHIKNLQDKIDKLRERFGVLKGEDNPKK